MKWPSGIRSKWNRKGWLLPYLFSIPFKRKKVIKDSNRMHVLFLFVDHFEPGHGGSNLAIQRERVEQWRSFYPELAGSFQDSEGVPPQHTWFFLGEDPEQLNLLSEMCFLGFGEVELHIHHGSQDRIPDHWKQNTLEGLAQLIENQKRFFSKYGALITAEPLPQHIFGFIHGMYALDNSLPAYCGVSGELGLLHTLGCYGDFSLPGPGKSQPSMINTLYYPTGDHKKGRSYFKGEEIRVGGSLQEKILLVQGPLGVMRKGLGFHIEEAQLEADFPPTPERIQYWLSRKIQVLGKPDWIFVKVHTHGAKEKNIKHFLGEPMIRLHSLLAEIVGSSSSCFLHYVTAREAFNIAMAAMAGAEGDPGQFRDFMIPPYANTKIKCNRPYHLESYSSQDWSLRVQDPEEVSLRIKGTPEIEIKADFLERINMRYQEKEFWIQAKGKGALEGRIKDLPNGFFEKINGDQEGKFQISIQPQGLLTFSGCFSSQGTLRVMLGQS